MSKLPVPRNGVVYDVKSLNMWANEIHEWGIEKGWATAELPDDPEKVKHIVIEKLLMMHTEITEATEELRDIEFDGGDYLRQLRYSFPHIEAGKPVGFASELIDELIRVLHLCAIVGIDIENEMEKKMEFNRTREYRHGGRNL